MSELLLADSAGCVNLVAEDEEGHLGELLDGKECVQLSLRLGEPLEVRTVDQEDDTVYLREVVAPKPTCWCAALSVGLGRKEGRRAHLVDVRPNHRS